jgi:hypothetical protein
MIKWSVVAVAVAALGCGQFAEPQRTAMVAVPDAPPRLAPAPPPSPEQKRASRRQGLYVGSAIAGAIGAALTVGGAVVWVNGARQERQALRQGELDLVFYRLQGGALIGTGASLVITSAVLAAFGASSNRD